MQLDLLDYITRYPSKPGYKAAGTSQEAAERVESKAATLRMKCLRLLEDIAPYGLTADELAERLGETVLSVRPRVSELLGLGLVMHTGERRKNASGMSASVWRCK